MKYGWVGHTGKIELDYHGAGDVYLTLLKNKTIGIPIHRTFCFVGYKSSILNFLLEHPVYLFESATDHLYLRGGREMEEGAKVWKDAVAKALGGALGTASLEVAQHAGELTEAMTGVLDIAHFGAEKGTEVAAEVSSKQIKSGKVGSIIDHSFNKRLIVTLESMTAPKVNSLTTLEQLGKTVHFAYLAGCIHNVFS